MKLVTVPMFVAAFLEHRGSYSKIGVTMPRLESWLGGKGIGLAGRPFCLFYDNPSETLEPELRGEACIPVRAWFPPEGEFRVREFQEVQAAETRHRGPPEEFRRTYGPFLEGLLRQGYRLLGPAREYFATVSDVKGPGSGYLIQQPIAEK